MSFGDDLTICEEALERFLAIDPDTVPGADADAVKATKQADRIVRLGTQARNRMARRVETCGAYAKGGARTAEQWLSQATGQPAGKAAADLRTQRRLESMPDVAEAAAKGEISPEQADLIAGAAEVDPDAAPALVKTAKRGTWRQLKEQTDKVKADARSEEDERARRDAAHKRRFLRSWVTEAGEGRIEALLTADGLAKFLAGLEPFFLARLGPDAEQVGRQALMADALVDMAEAASSGAMGGRIKPTVCLHVDLGAFMRGERDGEEACDIDGIGSVPVAVARQWFADDAILHMVVRYGADVTNVVTDSRHISKALDIALRHRQPRCAVASCDAAVGLERDHIRPFADGGPTSMENIQILCPWHHGLKTRAKCRFVDGPDGLEVLTPEEWSERFGDHPGPATEAPGSPPPQGAKTPSADTERRRRDRAAQTSRRGRRAGAPPPATGPPTLFESA